MFLEIYIGALVATVKMLCPVVLPTNDEEDFHAVLFLP